MKQEPVSSHYDLASLDYEWTIGDDGSPVIDLDPPSASTATTTTTTVSSSVAQPTTETESLVRDL